ncbi:MAG: glycerophosphodiester phosphodiesterase [Fidelibacterota bacterium]|nr:MAG: glycerophosphodiester phosphodiesterase [Candidatus Neomarinimicrobiota bacterium]
MPSEMLWLLLLVIGWAVVAGIKYLFFWRARGIQLYPEGQLQHFGHRGAPSHAPENTIPSFQAAFAAGMDGIELDVMETADGELVVMHDRELERLTNGSGYVRDTSYSIIAGLHVTYGQGQTSSPISVPSLEEVLDILPPGKIINIELKTRGWLDRGFEEKVVALVRRFRLVKRVIISSFNPLSLIKVRALEPEVAIGYIWRKTKVPWYLRKPYLMHLVHPDFFHPHVVLVTPEIVAKAHRRGMRVNVWTVNNRPMLRYLETIGVDGIFTDFPELVHGEEEA